jgi:hypothetical protein
VCEPLTEAIGELFEFALHNFFLSVVYFLK